jgi:hypothetical protein
MRFHYKTYHIAILRKYYHFFTSSSLRETLSNVRRLLDVSAYGYPTPKHAVVWLRIYSFHQTSTCNMLRGSSRDGDINLLSPIECSLKININRETLLLNRPDYRERFPRNNCIHNSIYVHFYKQNQ